MICKHLLPLLALILPIQSVTFGAEPQATSPSVTLPTIPDQREAFLAAQKRRQAAFAGTQAGDSLAALEMIELGMWDEMAFLDLAGAPLDAWRTDTSEIIPGVQRRHVWSELFANKTCREGLDHKALQKKLMEAIHPLLTVPSTTHPIILRETLWLLSDYWYTDAFAVYRELQHDAGRPQMLPAVLIGQVETRQEITRMAHAALQQGREHPEATGRAHRLRLLAEFAPDNAAWVELMTMAATAASGDPLMRLDIQQDIARHLTAGSWQFLDPDGMKFRSSKVSYASNREHPAQAAWEQALITALSIGEAQWIGQTATEALAWTGWDKSRAMAWADACLAGIPDTKTETRASISLAASRLCAVELPLAGDGVKASSAWRERQLKHATHALAMLGEQESSTRTLAVIEQVDARLGLGQEDALQQINVVGEAIAARLADNEQTPLLEAQAFLDRFLPHWLAQGSALEPICLPVFQAVDARLRPQRHQNRTINRQWTINMLAVAKALGRHGTATDRSESAFVLRQCIDAAEDLSEWKLEVDARTTLAEIHERSQRPADAAFAWLALAERYRANGYRADNPDRQACERLAGIQEEEQRGPVREVDETQGRFPQRIQQICRELAETKDDHTTTALTWQLMLLLGWPANDHHPPADLRQRARLGSEQCRQLLQRVGDDGMSLIIKAVTAVGPRPLGPLAEEALATGKRKGFGWGVVELMKPLIQDEPAVAKRCFPLAMRTTWGEAQQRLLESARKFFPPDEFATFLRNLLALPAKDLHGTAGLAIPLLAKLSHDLPTDDLFRLLVEGSWQNDRTQALLALAMISYSEIGPIVSALISDKETPIELRIAAIRCAGALRLQETTPLILPMLEDEILRDIALPVVTILGAAVPKHALRAWLSEDWGPEATGLDLHGPFQRWRIVSAAVIASLTTDWPEAYPRLSAVFHHPWIRYRIRAIDLIGRSGHPRAATLLLKLMDEDDRQQAEKEHYLEAFSRLPLSVEQRTLIEKRLGNAIPSAPPPIMPE